MVKKKVVCGYRKVDVFYDRALTFAPYAQCGVMDSTDGIVFVSYTTPVISIDDNGWLVCTGLYSRTTAKQIGYFLREYAPMITYQVVKKIYKDNMMINIHTGEVRGL